jgi:serine kinase of HPr protein (carbohydrate metabolism regulator)
MSAPFVRQAGCVACHGRGLLIEGAPGLGKSSLALALIDRGAVLVGDDGVTLTAIGGRLIAAPPPHTRGLIEVRNVGIVPMPVVDNVPVALVLRLSPDAPRFVENAPVEMFGGAAIPVITLWPNSPVLALRAEMALARHGLTFG